MENIKTHYDFIDYAKGIMILIVVLVHTGVIPINTVAFGMPLFFLVSGFTYNPGRRTLKENIARRFKGIMIPFWQYMIVVALIFIPLKFWLLGKFSPFFFLFGLLGMIWGTIVCPFKIPGLLIPAASHNMLSTIAPFSKSAAFLGISAPMWFLPAMFMASVFFYLLVDWTSRSSIRRIIGIVFLLLCAAVEIVFPALYQLPWGMGRGFFGGSLMLAGYWMKQSGVTAAGSKAKTAVLFILALAAYCALIHFNPDSAYQSLSCYGPFGAWSIPLSFLIGISGSFCLLIICQLISRIPAGFVKTFLLHTGKESLMILCLHTMLINIIDIIPVLLFKLPVKDGTMFYLNFTGWKNAAYRIPESIAVALLCILIQKCIGAVKGSHVPAQAGRQG